MILKTKKKKEKCRSGAPTSGELPHDRLIFSMASTAK
jgi:hypothetical protein